MGGEAQLIWTRNTSGSSGRRWKYNNLLPTGCCYRYEQINSSPTKRLSQTHTQKHSIYYLCVPSRGCADLCYCWRSWGSMCEQCETGMKRNHRCSQGLADWWMENDWNPHLPPPARTRINMYLCVSFLQTATFYKTWTEKRTSDFSGLLQQTWLQSKPLQSYIRIRSKLLKLLRLQTEWHTKT